MLTTALRPCKGHSPSLDTAIVNNRLPANSGIRPLPRASNSPLAIRPASSRIHHHNPRMSSIQSPRRPYVAATHQANPPPPPRAAPRRPQTRSMTLSIETSQGFHAVRRGGGPDPQQSSISSRVFEKPFDRPRNDADGRRADRGAHARSRTRLLTAGPRLETRAAKGWSWILF